MTRKPRLVADFSRRDKRKLDQTARRLERQTVARVKIIKVDSLGVEL